jgi:parallel beta-helix repeat protein
VRTNGAVDEHGSAVRPLLIEDEPMCVNRRVLWVAAVLACLSQSAVRAAEPRVVTLKPGPDVQEQTQEALIKAKPGDVIEFAAGTFEFTMGLSLTKENITVRGQGMDKTILSFKKQEEGKEGLLVTRGKFLLENLTIQDTKGDAVKVNDADGVTFRKVRTQWTGGAKASNGAYGLYPVQCKNVLIDGCVAIGASDAGIYVGQSQNVVIRGCKAEQNVAGIEIENCIDAEAYDNVATNNAGGLLVFDLPGLQQHNGKRVRVHDNRVYANNHVNFAPEGNMVASVAPGTGMMVLATDQVELFHNKVENNQTYGLIIVSFLVTGRPIEDKEYEPYPEAVYVHHNAFKNNGTSPAGDRGRKLASILGTPMPDIIYDGILNPKKAIDGKLPPDQRIYVKDNGSATVVNLHWEAGPKGVVMNPERAERNPKDLVGELPPLPAVRLAGVR